MHDMFYKGQIECASGKLMHGKGKWRAQGKTLDAKSEWSALLVSAYWAVLTLGVEPQDNDATFPFFMFSKKEHCNQQTMESQ